MNQLFNNLLNIIHNSITFIITIGPFLPAKYLIYYLFIGPTLYFHWLYNDNKCMITELEFKTDNNFFNNFTEYIFYKTKRTFSNYNKFNINFKSFESYYKAMIYYIIILWIVAFIRALVYYRKNISSFWSTIKKSLVRRLINDSYK